MAPPSSSGSTVGEALNILTGYHLSAEPRATRTVVRQLPNQQAAAAPAGQEGLHTNNIVTADKWGNIVAYTNTINFFGGSGQTVPATASCSTTR